MESRVPLNGGPDALSKEVHFLLQSAQISHERNKTVAIWKEERINFNRQ
jgi:hypothetical protein